MHSSTTSIPSSPQVNDDGVLACLNSVEILTDGAAVTLLSGVVLEQVSEHGGSGKIVDRYYLVTLSAEHLSERKTTNAALIENKQNNLKSLPPPHKIAKQGWWILALFTYIFIIYNQKFVYLLFPS